MRKLIILSLMAAASSVTFAKCAAPTDLVAVPMQAQAWLQSDSAKVSVNINGSVNNAGLGSLRQSMLVNLNKIVKGDWHITNFNRSQDNSGLEKVYATAQLRLPNNKLGAIRSKAKALSKPGIKYQVTNIQFIPSQMQTQATKANLRANIYTQAQKEILSLDKAFPNQKFRLFSINFQPHAGISGIRPMILAKTASNAVPRMNVGNKVTMNAMVSFQPKRQGPGQGGSMGRPSRHARPNRNQG
jgi:hypothetical protein